MSTDQSLDQPEKSRPYRHLTLEELRAHEDVTTEEWFDELEARGILKGGNLGGPKPLLKPIEPPVPPGGLKRFLKERG